MSVDAEHPLTQLEYVLRGQFDEAVVDQLRALISSLCASRRWTLSAPTLVDQPGESNPVAGSHLVGGALPLYSAYPPWGERLPTTVSAAQLAEVEVILDSMEAFSARTGTEFYIGYEGEQIGCIANGVTDPRIREGLLDTWRRSLSARPSSRPAKQRPRPFGTEESLSH